VSRRDTGGQVPPGDPATPGDPPAPGGATVPPDPANPDPRTIRAVRGAFAATLVLEALVVLLVPRTIAQFGSGLTAWKLTVLLVLAGLLVLAAALLRRPFCIPLGTGLQAALIACGLLTKAMLVLGVIFALVWYYLLRLRRDLLGGGPA
jgi:hypothetical protein